MKSVFLSVALFFSASIGSAIRAQTIGHQAASVPAGTALHVRTIDPIDANSARPGAKFRGSLADPVKTRDRGVVIPQGAPVQLSVVDVDKAGHMT
jgi:hypothetical protein